MAVGLFAAGWLCVPDAQAGGVTIITHGYNSDVSGWVTGMADQIANYSTFPGSNAKIYQVTLTTDGANYFYQWQRSSGGAPSNLDSGEIIVKLDWSQMAGGTAPYDISTTVVAGVASYVILQTNAISDLGGHALAELPIHLVGHSRGGSLMSELSRILGTNGVWVDQLTTLDPYPFNNDGNFDPFFPTDASAAHTYANVLYQDNYFQRLGGGLLDPEGEMVSGAYNRQLTSLSGGYGSDHSNVHLWYFGTISLVTPTSDTEASITSAERQSWWSAYEEQGTNAGFEYTLIGGSNRLSADQPVGPGFPAIRDGFNQWWNLGAGTSSNRVALATNNGNWPSLIRFDRLDTNPVVPGQGIMVNFYYQWAQPAASNATISFYLDNDLNPLNTNQTLLKQIPAPGSGAGSVDYGAIMLPLPASNATPGWHALFASINGGGPTRYLYAPEKLLVVAPLPMGIARAGASGFSITVNGLAGQTLVLQSSPDLMNWQPVATNTLSTNTWIYNGTIANQTNRLFFRTVLSN